MSMHDDFDTPAGLQRRHLLGLAGALLAGDALALTQALPDTEQGAQRGGNLQALVHPEPPTLAFFINTATPTRLVASKIFDGLLDYGPDLKPRGQLAERWELSGDGLQLRLWLRKNAFWHDGKPLTSADVKFSAEEVWKKHAPTGRRVFQNLTRVDAPDAHTVVLHLSKPAPVVLNALDVVSAPILPRHLYEGTDIPNNPHNNRPVGSGPFVFKEWSRGSHIALERFDKYWAPGLPYLDRLSFRVIPDVAGRAAALETGAVQYGERNPVTFADADRLARSDKLVVSTAGYNGFAGTLWLIPNLRDPIIGKLEVRQAILHAINRAALVKTVWGGYAAPATGPVSSQLQSYYTPDTQQYPFDRARAEQLLDAAGLPKKADGFRFKLTHAFIPYGDDYRRTGEFVRQSLRAVGIDVELKAQDLASWTKDVFADYNYQLVSSWGINWADPQLGLEQHYWSKAESKGTPWQNASGYASAETDRVIEAAQTERDPARRRELYNQLQQLVQKDLPLLHLFEFRWFGVWDKRLRNVTDSYNNSQSNFARVWFDGAA